MVDGNRTIAALEEHWQQQVGAERYRAFRRVLEDLANASVDTDGHDVVLEST